MNSRERLLAALQRQPVDHVPCVIVFNPLLPAQREGHAWQFPWPASAGVEERLAYEIEVLGLDSAVNVSIDLTAPDPAVTSRAWVEGGSLHKVYDTPAGRLQAEVRYDERWPHGHDIPLFSDFNVGHFIKPWLETESDLERLACLRQPITDVGRLAELAERVRAAKALSDRYQILLQAACGTGLTGAQHLCGAAGLCLLAIDNPDLVDAYLAMEHEQNLRAIAWLGEQGVDTVRRNGFYETADFYSPKMLQRFLGRRLAAEAEACHAAGMLLSYTVNTGLMPIIEYLEELPLDSLFGIELAQRGVDPVVIRERLGRTKSLWLGPSSAAHLWAGPQATRQAVHAVFDTFDRTGLILAPAVSAHSIMPWESTIALIDAWRERR